jgi:hypothetical protein
VTENQAAQLVLRKLHMTEAQMSKPVIVSRIPSACDKFSELVAMLKNERELLRADYSISVVSGVGSLSTALTSATPLKSQFANGWSVYASDSTFPYGYCANKESLLLDRPTSVGWFAVDGSSLLVVDSLGSRTPTATYTVRGNFICNIGTVPIQIEDKFIDVLAAEVMPEAQTP